MEIEIKKKTDIVVITVHEDIALYNAPMLKKEGFDQFEAGANELIIDLFDVSYIDSTGLGTLVAIHKKFSENHGLMVVTNISGTLRKVFEVTKLEEILCITPNENEAQEKILAHRKLNRGK